jgi:hypothetical protein
MYLRTVLLFALAYLLAPTMASAETLYACKLNGIGTVRMVSATTNCSSQYETKISWNSTGAQGPPGQQGPAGLTGPQGLQGLTGAQGVQGLMGPPGLPGTQGTKGDTGPAGAKGADGAIGPAGQNGAIGAQGPKGDTGPQGLKGDKGDPGSGTFSCNPPNIYLVAQAGGALTCQPRFNDNGDGTLTDNQTGLMWERKTGTVNTAYCLGNSASDVHDVNNCYTWSATVPNPDGTLYTGFLATLNSNSTGNPASVCFANHCDWRIATIVELQTIIDLSATGCGEGPPCIDSAFGATWAGYYWSSSSVAGNPSNALSVYFGVGNVSDFFGKNLGNSARAVRGGR